MKYLRIYEDYNENEIRCTIDIRFLMKEEIVQLAKKLIKMFPYYNFNERFIHISNDNSDYTQYLNDYSHIELYRTYTYFEAGEFDNRYYFAYSGTVPIPGKMFLEIDDLDELVKNIDTYKSTKKYNL